MVSSVSDVPKDAKGEIILNAHLWVAPGKAEKAQEYITAIKKFSLSDDEPGCLEYRTSRSFVTEGVVKFSIWERYTGPGALDAHMRSPPFQAMISAEDLFASPPQVEYYYEF